MKNILIILLLTVTTIHAQRPSHERIKAARAGVFTEALELTTSEAEKFWPIYNTYDDKVRDIKRSERKALRNVFENGGISGISELEANELIENTLSFRDQELQLRRKLMKDLDGVISKKKVLKLYKAEEDFKKRLLEMMRGRKGRN